MSAHATSIIIFDTETTGTNTERDQIIELSIQWGLKDDSPRKTWRIRPTVPIAPDAQKVHGITMEDLADCPKFSKCADPIRGAFNEAEVVVGYNVRFDLDILQAEYVRLRQPTIDLTGTLIVDPLRLWQACEPRSLQDAHTRFVGQEYEDAHSSAADVAATGRVLRGMKKTFGLKDRDWDEIADICEPERRSYIGPSHHFQWREGIAVVAFGKHDGKAIHALAVEENGGYLRWMLDKDFPQHVKEICRRALAGNQKSFCDWLIDAYGPPPSHLED